MDSAQKIIYHFSLYFQAWFLIYGLTGNVGHYTQDYYYPAWISENSYTLTGTCLAARNTQDSQTGYWDNQSYDLSLIHI